VKSGGHISQFVSQPEKELLWLSEGQGAIEKAKAVSKMPMTTVFTYDEIHPIGG